MHMRIEKGHIVENEVEARGAFLDPPVLAILIVSMSLICALYALIYFGYFGL